MRVKDLKEKPKGILFNTEMVFAILSGRKTQTCRLVRNMPNTAKYMGFCMDSTEKKNVGCNIFKSGPDWMPRRPYTLPGRLLYVREAFKEWTDGYVYKAWGKPFPQPGCYKTEPFKPGIHMPKEAARIFLLVDDVKIARLQDITDFTAEGIPEREVCKKAAFAKLWDSTLSKKSYENNCYEANPYIEIIRFHKIEKPEDWDEYALYSR